MQKNNNVKYCNTQIYNATLYHHTLRKDSVIKNVMKTLIPFIT